MPIGVLVPRSWDDVAAAIAIARELKVPVLPRGAGTSQCGQTVGAALAIDTTKYLRKILSVDAQARTASALHRPKANIASTKRLKPIQKASVGAMRLAQQCTG